VARVVVGVDGSPASHEALTRAAAEAELRHLPLCIVTAWTIPIVATPYLIDPDPTPFAQGAKQLLEELVDEVKTAYPSMTIDPDTVCDDARSALLDRVEPDDLLVVGSRGHSGVVGLLLGSVATYCVNHAPCPVLVVPPQHQST
jgi:nucleotide-binding universal stress UspA family protein